MYYVRFPLSLRNVEGLLHERGIDVCHETVRYWWQRGAPMFAYKIKERRIEGMKSSRWRRRLDEVFANVSGKTHDLWRAVYHEGDELQSYASTRRDNFKLNRTAALAEWRAYCAE